MIKGKGENELKLLIQMGFSDRRARRRASLLKKNLLNIIGLVFMIGKVFSRFTMLLRCFSA